MGLDQRVAAMIHGGNSNSLFTENDVLLPHVGLMGKVRE
jgi:hypothetical protein